MVDTTFGLAPQPVQGADMAQQVMLGTGAGQGLPTPPVTATAAATYAPATPMPPPPTMFTPPADGESERNWQANLEMMGASLSGQLPMSLRIRQAEMSAKADDLRYRQGWANLQNFEQNARNAMQEHRMSTKSAVAEMIPKFRASWLMSDESQRPHVEQFQRSYIATADPEAMPFYDSFVTKPATQLGMMYLMKTRPELQEMAQMVGYPFFENKTFQDMADVVTYDMASKLTASIPQPLQAKAGRGEMTQTEFLKAAETQFFSGGSQAGDPQLWQLLKTFYTHSDKGAGLLANYGITSDQVALKRQQKLTEHQDIVNTEIKRLQAVPERTADQEHQLNAMLGSGPKGTGTSGNAGRTISTADRYVAANTPGEGIANVTQLVGKQKEAADAGNYAEVSRFQKILDLANTQAAQAPAQARTDVARDTALGHKEEVYSKAALRSNALTRITKNLPTENELNSGKTDAVYISKPNKDKLEDIFIAKGQASQMFGAAKELMTATGTFSAAAQAAEAYSAEKGVYIGKNAAAWKTYQESKQAWASRLARAIGTERGVMTDTDVQRWEAILPKSNDTREVVGLKQKYFEKMYGYIRDISKQVAAGDLDDNILSADGKSYTNEKVGSTINGILGDFKDKVKSSGERKEAADSMMERMQRKAK